MNFAFFSLFLFYSAKKPFFYLKIHFFAILASKQKIEAREILLLDFKLLIGGKNKSVLICV